MLSQKTGDTIEGAKTIDGDTIDGGEYLYFRLHSVKKFLKAIFETSHWDYIVNPDLFFHSINKNGKVNKQS